MCLAPGCVDVMGMKGGGGTGFLIPDLCHFLCSHPNPGLVGAVAEAASARGLDALPLSLGTELVSGLVGLGGRCSESICQTTMRYAFWSLSLGPKFLGVNWDPGFVGGGGGAQRHQHVLPPKWYGFRNLCLRQENCWDANSVKKPFCLYLFLDLLVNCGYGVGAIASAVVGLERTEDCGMTVPRVLPLRVSCPELTAHTPTKSRSEEAATFLTGCVTRQLERRQSTAGVIGD